VLSVVMFLLAYRWKAIDHPASAGQWTSRTAVNAMHTGSAEPQKALAAVEDAPLAFINFVGRTEAAQWKGYEPRRRPDVYTVMTILPQASPDCRQLSALAASLSGKVLPITGVSFPVSSRSLKTAIESFFGGGAEGISPER